MKGCICHFVKWQIHPFISKGTRYMPNNSLFVFICFWVYLFRGICSAVQCSAVQCSAVQCSAVQCSAVQCSAVQYSTVQYSTVQYSTVQYSTVQYSTVQYSTVQYSTVQYSTVQFTVPCRVVQSSEKRRKAGQHGTCRIGENMTGKIITWMVQGRGIISSGWCRKYNTG